MTEDRGPALSTGSLSLVDLRRHLLRRASTLTARARARRARGDVAGATRLSHEAARLFRVAHDMGRSRPA